MDDLKAIWAKNPPPASDLSEELRLARERKVADSATKLKRRLGLEAGVVALVFVAILFAWQNGLVYKSRTVLWMLALAGVSVLPVFWRLGRAVLGLSRPDFSKNIVENLRKSILELRRELKIYLWSLYGFTAIMSVLLFIDPFVFWKKAALLAFLLLTAFFGKYWVRLLYGRELSKLEAELREWEKGN